MKIHIHGHSTGTGVATYQYNLHKELTLMGHETHRTIPWKREWIVMGRRVGGFITQRIGSLIVKPCPNAHVMHAVSNWVYPLGAGSIMVHDLNPLRLPGWGPSRRMFQRQRQRLRSSILLTPTQSIRQSLSDWLNIEPDLITVAPNGVNIERFQPVKRRREYILSVGDYRDYKRVEDAVSIAESTGWDLVRVGPPANDSYGKAIQERARQTLGKSFYDFGYVDGRELPQLYAEAQALVFTSRYEGFGIPPLEASACGTPSILADTPVNREIHGDLAVYLNGSFDLRSEVEDMQQNGNALRRNASRFTWKRSAEKHVEAWRKYL